MALSQDPSLAPRKDLAAPVDGYIPHFLIKK